MSDWFQPVPQALDSIAYAVKVLKMISRRCARYYVPSVPTGCDGFTTPILSFAAPAFSPGLRTDQKRTV
jgi:hypothetical protein